MVGNRRSEEVVDPKIPEPPSSKALKRVLLVALRCVDPDANKRPKMGHIIHMLEAEDLLFRDERRTTRDHGTRERQETAVVAAAGSESGESGSRQHQQKQR
ncbi:PREDICTED: probable serine/threonine-protein kinase At1g01540 [Camelina sativa]|nr:PREDICTED: probable serine/threonine-protein kinase At1g01540 [Camelina sativa]